MVWGEYGVKGKVIGDLDWGAELTTRFGSYGMETFFPQLTLRYKVTSWFRPSVDFRSIFNLDEYGNYLNSSRLNFNADFKHAFDRIKLGARVRYQYSFNSLGNNENYDAEFDQAVRIKPSIAYDIKGSIVTPNASIELFYNPAYGPEGRQFRKYRIFAGVDLEFDSPHEVAVGYILDGEMNRVSPEMVHILSIAYAYNLDFKSKDKKKKKKTVKTIQTL